MRDHLGGLSVSHGGSSSQMICHRLSFKVNHMEKFLRSSVNRLELSKWKYHVQRLEAVEPRSGEARHLIATPA